MQRSRARQRAYLIAALHDGQRDDLGELRELLRTAGVAGVGEMVQHRALPHPNTYLGPGKLEQLGHVSRRRDPADRRRHIVELTAAGRRALARAERAQEAIEDDVLGALDAEERATLWRLLTRALYGVERARGVEAIAQPAYSPTTASIST